MKKNKNFKLVMSAIVASVVVSLLVTGVVAKANGSNLLGDVIQLLGLAKELGNTPTVNEGVLGTNLTTDEIQTSNFNSLALATNTNHPEYINAEFQYMELLSNAASSTVLSIKNDWSQWILVTDVMAFPTAMASSGLYISAGTSTNQSAASYTTTADISKCAINNQFITTSTMDIVSSNSPANAVPERGVCLVAPGDFFLVHVKTANPVISATSSVLTSIGADLKVTAKVRVISTSTQAY